MDRLVISVVPTWWSLERRRSTGLEDVTEKELAEYTATTKYRRLMGIEDFVVKAWSSEKCKEEGLTIPNFRNGKCTWKERKEQFTKA